MSPHPTVGELFAAIGPSLPRPSLRAWAMSCTSRPALSINGAQPEVYLERLGVDTRRAARAACISAATRQRAQDWDRMVQAGVRGELPPTVSADAERQRAAATSTTIVMH